MSGPILGRRVTIAAVLELAAVSLVRGDRHLLQDVTWSVGEAERWVVLGRNGSGKTTLLRVASLYEHPSSGTVRVLGETLGRTDVRRLRRRVGIVSPALADQLRPSLAVLDVVLCGLHAALEPWWHSYGRADHERAHAQLSEVGVGHVAHQPFGACSSGERQRVLLARELMADPALVLLDEPTAGLDLAGREELVEALGRPTDAAIVLVTHHLEEIPPSFGHALLLRAGRALAQGPIGSVLESRLVSQCFDLPVVVDRIDGRWSARREVSPPR